MDTTKYADINAVNLAWLIKLRWVAVVGQAGLIVAAELMLDFALPLGVLSGIILLTAMSNIGVDWWYRQGRPVSETLLATVLIADMMLLTVLLYATGGPANPFSFLYLVHISLAAVVLRRNWLVSGVFGLAGLLYGLLFVLHSGWHHMGGAGGHMRSHLEGMWVAMVVTGGLTAYFIHTIRRSLQAHEDALAELRQDEARREKLASLATMAAGAAHELSTPLSVIAVVARELERSLPATQDDALAEDAVLIRDQVRRCQEILGQMSMQGGRQPGESSSQVAAGALLEEIKRRVRAPQRVEVVDRNLDQIREAYVQVPLNAVAGAIAELVHNGLDASDDDQMVRLELDADADWLFRFAEVDAAHIVFERRPTQPERRVARARSEVSVSVAEAAILHAKRHARVDLQRARKHPLSRADGEDEVVDLRALKTGSCSDANSSLASPDCVSAVSPQPTTSVATRSVLRSNVQR